APAHEAVQAEPPARRPRAGGDGARHRRGRLPPLHVQRGGPDGALAPEGDRSSRDSASNVDTSTTRRSSPRDFTPSSSITVQNGHATASVSAPVSAASRTR